MKQDTRIAHSGSHPENQHGLVNPPVYRGSTVVFPTLDAYEHSRGQRYDTVVYGRAGTPTTMAFEEAVAALNGGHRSIAVSSGLAAITATLMAFLSAGDHILVTDSVYGPNRSFCDKVLARFGVTVTYYDPLCGGAIAEAVRPETKVVFAESPGSHTFDVQDIPAMAGAIRNLRGSADAPVLILDNTWATGLGFPGFEHGADIIIEAATKYLVGHSDAMLGVITVRNEEHFIKIKRSAEGLGNCPGSEESYLGLRGLRTLAVRLRQHEKNALEVARWLQQQPRVARVMYPPLAEDPGHALWKRDFTGASGLLGIVLDQNHPREAIAAFIDGLRYFGLGASWGGYESLILPFQPPTGRTATTWAEASPTLRLHIGLEDPNDLIADLAAAFDRLDKAGSE
ncbi:MAG: cystathionine beta-lyase [bacterium]|nr:cystathionine beta-lyase [bacterium]